MATAASTLITRCLDNLSRASTGQARSGATMETKALDWMNTVMRKISYVHDFRDMYKKYTTVTVSSQKGYSFPTNFKTILDLNVIDGYSSSKLEMVLPQKFDKYIPYPEQDSQDIPRWYVPYGVNFDVYPIPGTAYTLNIRTIQWPTTITGTSDVLEYDSRLDDIIVAGMTAEGFRFLQMYEDALMWSNDYNMLLAQAVAVDSRHPDWNPVGQGFNSGDGYVPMGEYWNRPFVDRSP